ncbi:hypothetical protein [Undibacterium sp. Di24W]|uniref:hypothetical protein n=1 Tax=Undibacterium sp. Di24W TaxID=3413033 RepID=UPI003BF03912
MKSPKRYKKLWFLFVLLFLMLSLWWGSDTQHRDASTSAVDDTYVWFARLNSDSNSKSKSVTSASPAQKFTDASSTKTRSHDEPDICSDIVKTSDHGRLAKDMEPILERYLRQADPAIEQALMQILQTGDPRQKGSALALQAEIQESKARDRFLDLHPNCENNEDCEAQLSMAVESAAKTQIDAIAKMAVYSSDPKLYAMAYNACKPLAAQRGFCTQINATQWASRDPENGTTWMHVFQELSRAGAAENQSMIANALYKLSKAKRFDAYIDVSSYLSEQFMPKEDTLAQARMQNLAWQVLIKSPLPHYSLIINACKGNLLDDGNRRQMCEEITQQLLRQDGSIIDFGIARKMGENLGWDKTTTQVMQEEILAINAMLRDRAKKTELQLKSQEGMLLACREHLNQFNQGIKMMSEGEYKQYRLELDQYPLSRAELVHISREAQKAAQASKN